MTRIGTRGSPLALAQATMVEAAIRATGRAAQLVVIETEGDRRMPDTAWGEGAFVATIEKVLLEERIDVAVHSAKDVPTAEDPRLRIAAYLPRAEPRDALVVRTGVAIRRSIEELPAGSLVGTDSPRRTGFLLGRRPDLRVEPLHGNVDTRLRRLDEGKVDALILATAGLMRLGRAERIDTIIDPWVIPPAPGQGAIAVQVRADDVDTSMVVAEMDDASTRVAVEVERGFLRQAGGGCRSPIGALATVVDGRLRLIGGYAEPDGSAVVIDEVSGSIGDRDALVRDLGARLATRPTTRRGEATPRRIVGHAPAPWTAAGLRLPTPARRPRVLVTRTATAALPLVEELSRRGLDPIVVPCIEIRPTDGEGLRRELAMIDTYAWVVVTSVNGAEIVLDAIRGEGADPGVVRWAAIGRATAAVLERVGVVGPWLPAVARAALIGSDLPITPGDRVLLARAALGDPTLAAGLRHRGAIVSDIVAYDTIEGPEASREPLRAALAAPAVDAVLFASGSAVRGFLRLAGPGLRDRCRTIPAICIGAATSEVALAHGLRVLGEAESPDSGRLADRVSDLLQPIPEVSR